MGLSRPPVVEATPGLGGYARVLEERVSRAGKNTRGTFASVTSRPFGRGARVVSRKSRWSQSNGDYMCQQLHPAFSGGPLYCSLFVWVRVPGCKVDSLSIHQLDSIRVSNMHPHRNGNARKQIFREAAGSLWRDRVDPLPT